MSFLSNFQLKVLKHDLLNKFNYKNINDLPKMKKIILNFSCRTSNIKRLATAALALELITNKKGVLTRSKKSNILLKIRKGNPIGCKITLRKKSMLKFLEKTLIEVFPGIKSFTGLKVSKRINKNSFSYELRSTLNFSELEKNYYLFNNLPKLAVTITATTTRKEEFLFILKAFQLFFNKSKFNYEAFITQLVECNLAKIKVKGSNPFICLR